MAQFIARRLAWTAFILLLISLITFFLMHQVPGGPWDRERRLPPQTIANLNQYYHLDWPLWRQYVNYMDSLLVPRVTQAATNELVSERYMVNVKIGATYVRWMNFGPSYVNRSRGISDIFREQLPVSMQLGVMATLVAFGLGIPLGILAALKQNTFWDYAGMGFAIAGASLPILLTGLTLVYIFGVWLHVLPATGWGSQPPYVLGFLPSRLSWDYFKYAVMPASVMGFSAAGPVARLMRASLLEVIREEYIRTAQAKGLPGRIVILRHALKNALAPVATLAGPSIAGILTGSFVIELVFGIPGLGKYFVYSISNRDYPIILSTVLLAGMFLVIANLVVDIVYAYLNPRIRYT